MSRAALIVIDVQNDYFPGGAFPLWNPEAALAATLRAIRVAQANGLPVIHVQHVADPDNGPAPFFNEGTAGVAIHPDILAAAPDAPVIVKRYADAFDATELQATLQALGVDELLLCGMMTHNCVTHTALSRRADDYRCVTVLGEACTTASEALHRIALSALSRRVKLATVDAALA